MKRQDRVVFAKSKSSGPGNFRKDPFQERKRQEKEKQNKVNTRWGERSPAYDIQGQICQLT